MHMSKEEILINARRIRPETSFDTYEFVVRLDDDTGDLYATECVHVESLIEGIIAPVDAYQSSLKEVLFELNHVRVNPRMDNSIIINRLTELLEHIGVEIHNPPTGDSIAICFKPLGEIKDNVRFFMEKDGQLQFLTTAVHLHVIRNKELIARQKNQHKRFY